MALTIQVIPVFKESVRVLLRIARTKPFVVLVPAVLVAVLNYFELQTLANGVGSGSIIPSVSKYLGQEVVGACILSVMAISIHRLVLLPPRDGYDGLFVQADHFACFAALASLATLLSNILIVQMALQTGGLIDIEHWPPIVSALPNVLSYGLPFCGLLLFSCLFPAIAIDAPGARLLNGVLDTRFDLHRIAALAVLCFVPGVVVSQFLSIILTLDALGPSNSWWLFVALKTIPHVMSVSLLAVAASLAFRCFANRLLDKSPHASR